MLPSASQPAVLRLARSSPVPVLAVGSAAQIVVEDAVQATVLLGEDVMDARCILGAGCSVQMLGAWRDGASPRLMASLGAGAHMQWHLAMLGGRGTLTMTTELAGDDARSDVDAIVVAGEGGAPGMQITNDYQGRRGSGDIAMRVVAAGESRATCRGMIRIGEQGGGTDTYLAQRALLLGPHASVDALPALEIRTNDVKASHGATVTRVTPLDLFSFAARGIAPTEARRLFVEGFLRTSLERAPDAQWRQRVQHDAVTIVAVS